MINKQSKEEAAKIRSLMERVETPMTFMEAVANEKNLITESERVNSNTFLEFLTKYNVTKGPFVQLGYIQLYPTDSQYPSDDLYNNMNNLRSGYKEGSRGLATFDSYMDKLNNPEWLNPTGRAYKGQKSMSKKLYSYIIKLTKYTLHWQTEKDFGSRVAGANKKLSDLTNGMSDNLKAILGVDQPNQTNRGGEDLPRYRKVGPLGDFEIATFADKDGNPYKNEYYTDPDDQNSLVQYDRSAIRNFLSDVKAQYPVYFGVNEDGTIDEIPRKLGEILYNVKQDNRKKLEQISDPEEEKMAKAYFSQMRNNMMATKTFLLQNVAYICGMACENGEISGKSVYWINKNPLFLLKKSATKARGAYSYLFQNLNNEELESILNRFARSQSDELEALANTNVKGNAMYAQP